MILFFVIFCFVCVGVLLAAERIGDRRLKWIAKPAASAAFIALATAEGALAGDPFGILMLTGLALCGVGDVLLIAKARWGFLAGMAAFAAGHAAYAGAFASASPSLKPGVAIAAIIMIAATGFVLRALWGKLGAMRTPVIAYMIVISVMAVMSVAATPADGGYVWILIAGAFGFAASDIAVARDQFHEEAFANKAWGLPLYYGAQLLLASSI